MSPLIIIGTGGHGREALEVAHAMQEEGTASWQHIAGFIDDNPRLAESTVNGLPVLGKVDYLKGAPPCCIAVALGNPALRKQIVQQLSQLIQHEFVQLIHPTAVIGSSCTLGKGIMIWPKVVITTNVHIDHHVVLNTATTLSHDCTLEDFATLAPGCHLAGGVVVGEGCDLGTGTICKPRVTLGAWCRTGAGTVIVKNTEPKKLYVGVPGIRA